MEEDNNQFIFDLDEIVKFVFGEKEERTHDTEITETYLQPKKGSPVELSSKVIHEVKGSDNTNKQTIKYDMIKMFVDILDGVENPSIPSTLGQSLTFNTMVSYGLIKQIQIKN